MQPLVKSSVWDIYIYITYILLSIKIECSLSILSWDHTQWLLRFSCAWWSPHLRGTHWLPEIHAYIRQKNLPGSVNSPFWVRYISRDKRGPTKCFGPEYIYSKKKRLVSSCIPLPPKWEWPLHPGLVLLSAQAQQFCLEIVEKNIWWRLNRNHFYGRNRSEQWDIWRVRTPMMDKQRTSPLQDRLDTY